MLRIVHGVPFHYLIIIFLTLQNSKNNPEAQRDLSICPKIPRGEVKTKPRTLDSQLKHLPAARVSLDPAMIHSYGQDTQHQPGLWLHQDSCKEAK